MDDKWRLSLGTLVIICLIVLAGCIAVGRVEEKTSFGLSPILMMLGKFTLDFSEWAFRKRDKDE